MKRKRKEGKVVTEQDPVDTITPLDGEDGNVTGLQDQFGNTPESEYETKGKTTVATRHGYRFASSNKDVPVIHSGGVKVTKEVADELVKESKDSRAEVRIVEDSDEKKGD